MQNEYLIRKLRPLVVPVIVLIALLAALLWVSRHAFIEISVQGKTTGSLTYTLVNQETGEEKIFQSSDTTVKKIVGSGKYEVIVESENSSYLTTQTAGRYLSTSRVNGNLVKQLEREFVGYNPAPCAIYIGGILRSHECDSEFSSLNVHVPATASQPTYTQNAGIGIDTELNGIAYTSFGPVAFTDPVFVTEEIISRDYQVGLLNDDLSISRAINIDYLALGVDYKIKAYMDGFILYSDDLLDVYYYSSLEAAPIKLKVELPKDSDQRAIGLTVSGPAIVRYFSNNLGGEEETEETTAEEVLSEIYIYNGEKNIKYTTPDFLLGASVCTENRLCVLSGDSVLKVYSTTGKQLKEEYKYTGVQELHQSGSDTYFISGKGVVSIDGKNGSGHYVYTFGRYQYCGLQLSLTGSIVCLIDSRQNKLALSLITGQLVTNLLDKKVDALSTAEGIENVSLYKNVLFVTPQVIENNEEITFSSEQVRRGQKNLDTALKRTGIDTSDLIVVNTANPS